MLGSNLKKLNRYINKFKIRVHNSSKIFPIHYPTTNFHPSHVTSRAVQKPSKHVHNWKDILDSSMEIESFCARGHLVEKYSEIKTQEEITILYIQGRSHTIVTYVHKPLEGAHLWSVTIGHILVTSHLCVSSKIAQCGFRWRVL